MEHNQVREHLCTSASDADPCAHHCNTPHDFVLQALLRPVQTVDGMAWEPNVSASRWGRRNGTRTATAFTMMAVAVATPLMRCRKLSAIRSPRRMESAEPVTIPNLVPFTTLSPPPALLPTSLLLDYSTLTTTHGSFLLLLQVLKRQCRKSQMKKSLAGNVNANLALFSSTKFSNPLFFSLLFRSLAILQSLFHLKQNLHQPIFCTMKACKNLCVKYDMSLYSRRIESCYIG